MRYSAVGTHVTAAKPDSRGFSLENSPPVLTMIQVFVPNRSEVRQGWKCCRPPAGEQWRTALRKRCSVVSDVVFITGCGEAASSCSIRAPIHLTFIPAARQYGSIQSKSCITSYSEASSAAARGRMKSNSGECKKTGQMPMSTSHCRLRMATRLSSRRRAARPQKSDAQN